MDAKDDGKERIEKKRNLEVEMRKHPRKARRAAEARRGDLLTKSSETKDAAKERESRKVNPREGFEKEGLKTRTLRPREAAGLRRQKYENYAEVMEHAGRTQTDVSPLLDKVKGLSEDQRMEFLRSSSERFQLKPHEIAVLRTETKREIGRNVPGEHEEFNRLVAAGKIRQGKPTEQLLDSTRIVDPDEARLNRNPTDRRFWYRHGNTPENYRSLAEKYPQLQKELEAGKPLEMLRKDKSYRDAARFWYAGENDKIKVNKHKDAYYAEEGHHRLKLSQIYNLGPIPVRVTEWS